MSSTFLARGILILLLNFNNYGVVEYEILLIEVS